MVGLVGATESLDVGGGQSYPRESVQRGLLEGRRIGEVDGGGEVCANGFRIEFQAHHGGTDVPEEASALVRLHGECSRYLRTLGQTLGGVEVEILAGGVDMVRDIVRITPVGDRELAGSRFGHATDDELGGGDDHEIVKHILAVVLLEQLPLGREAVVVLDG